MAAKEHQTTLASKAGVSVAVAEKMSGADLAQAAIFNQSGSTVGQVKGTTQILVSSSAARNLSS